MTCKRLVTIVLLMMAVAAPEALGRTQASLGDLDISAGRVPDWWPVEPTDTSGWDRVDVTRDAGTLSCSNARKDDGNSDASALQCMIDAAKGTQTVLYLPAGRYELKANQGLRMQSSVALEGDGVSTVLNLTGQANYVANSCKSRSFINFNGSEGPSTSWTGGYTRGTTQLKVADSSLFRAGDWVVLHMEPDTSKLTRVSSGSGDFKHHWEYTVKVAAVGAGTITIDRPLRIDYTARGGRTVRRLETTSGSGLQAMKIRYRDNAQDTGTHVVCMKRATENWVRDIEFDGFYGKAVFLEVQAARNLVFRNYMHDTFIDQGLSSYPVHLSMGASDNQVHMNYCTNGSKCITIQQGPVGNLITYNYGKDCNTHNRLVFFHGEYASENLVEGNEMDRDCSIDYDNWYGIQGPRNTFFRNRSIDDRTNNAKPSSIRSHMDKADDAIAEMPNLLLNFGPAFYQSVGCKDDPSRGGAYEDGYCASWDYDRRNSENGGKLYSSPWAERNVAFDTRSADQCTGNETPYKCCTGPSTAKDSCAFGAAFSSSFTSGNVENYSRTSAPASWSSDEYPYSLVTGWNDPGVRPPGWCEEINRWPLMGADVDSAPVSALPKSPAHRLFDGDACTPLASSGSVTPPPPPPSPDPEPPASIEPPVLLP